MNKKYIMPFALAILILALITSPMTFAASTNDNITVNVNISSVGAIVVSPNSISWAATAPGSNTATTNIIIKNTGSENVSNIYMTTSAITDESTNPLQTADPNAYSAAGFIFVKNSTETTYSHAGRLEWNLSTILTGETLSITAGTTAFGHGWYRNSTGNEYLWKVENGTAGLCNNTGATFDIEQGPENDTTLSRDITANPSTCSAVTVGAWGVFTCSDGPLNGYCVAAASTCDKIYIYKNDYSSTFPTCNNREYLRSANLIPGTEDSLNVFASIPLGMPAGDTNEGILTIVATY